MNKSQMSKLKTQNQNSNLKYNIRYRAYQFSLKIIELVEGFPERRFYWIIDDQLLRAATSIGANLIEAKSSSPKRDFIRFYEIALKSANETRYWLCLLRDSKLSKDSLINPLLKEAEEIAKMIGSSLLTMKKKKD
jgi:four helix bundle protein